MGESVGFGYVGGVIVGRGWGCEVVGVKFWGGWGGLGKFKRCVRKLLVEFSEVKGVDVVE